MVANQRLWPTGSRKNSAAPNVVNNGAEKAMAVTSAMGIFGNTQNKDIMPKIPNDERRIWAHTRLVRMMLRPITANHGSINTNCAKFLKKATSKG